MAVRLVSARGDRAFVKAIATSRHAQTAALHRYEMQAMQAIPPSPMLPALYAGYDDGDWVALLLEDIDGRHPLRWTPDEVRVVATAVDRLTATFTPTPWPRAQRLEDAPRVRTTWWERITRDEAPRWILDHRDDLVAMEVGARAAVPGQTLCHHDIQAENIFLTDHDRVVFVDWAWASRSAAWVDTMNLAGEIVTGGSDVDVDELLRHGRHTRGVDPRTLTGYLASQAGSAYLRARRPDTHSLPALQDYRRTRADALLGWLRHRTGW